MDVSPNPLAYIEILSPGAVTTMSAGLDGSTLLQKYANQYQLMFAYLSQVDAGALMRARGVEIKTDDEINLAVVFDAHAEILRRLAVAATEAADDFNRVAAEDRERTASSLELAELVIKTAKGKG